MKKIKSIYPILLILTILLFNYCNKNKCHQVVGPDGRIFSFRVIDPKTNETAIAAWGAKYDSDDIFFEQKSKDTVRGLQILGTGDFSFYLIDDIGPNNRDEIVNKEFTNTYFLHLNARNENLETDIDTIMISSEIISVDDDCVPIGCGATTIVYNDSIYHQGDYIDSIDFLKKL